MQMQKKISIVSLIIAILLIVSIAIGTSYSLWTTTVHQESTNTIEVGCFRIDFNDTGFNWGANINLDKAYPITNNAGKLTQPYIFSITNQCSVASSYNVNLETLNTSTLDEKVLDVYFNDLSVKRYVDNISDGLSDDAKSGMSLTRGYLGPGETVKYDLKIWIDYSVTTETENVQGKTWNGRVVVNSEATFTKPTFTNKVVSDDNVTLDINTGSDKEVESITCYYGGRTSQTNEGTAVGTTKCQYPLTAEYAKYTVNYTDGTSDTSVVKKLSWYVVKDGQFLGVTMGLNEGQGGGWIDYYITKTQKDDYLQIFADYSNSNEDDGCGWLYSPFDANEYSAAILDLEFNMNCAANQVGALLFYLPKNTEEQGIHQLIYYNEGQSTALNYVAPRNTYVFNYRNNEAFNTTDYDDTMFQIGGQGQCSSTQKIYNLNLQYAE